METSSGKISVKIFSVLIFTPLCPCVTRSKEVVTRYSTHVRCVICSVFMLKTPQFPTLKPVVLIKSTPSRDNMRQQEK
ncbi:CLUMA_CG001011, isoform A [Clunio marinus]|uniref:CLUMA_CG001011, isoform A n=1 Tax=Clunio marinus TaxID=568069 RepID=A0A1J1HGR9_9DIPT|nr:CLUMA_CG001011, isoform A [Clunio marinus]